MRGRIEACAGLITDAQGASGTVQRGATGLVLIPAPGLGAGRRIQHAPAGGRSLWRRKSKLTAQQIAEAQSQTFSCLIFSPVRINSSLEKSAPI
jgi:hypothetical protein